MKKRKLGIIGGSGLYKMEGFEKTKWRKINTPWGKPSDEVLIAKLGKEEIYFIPRHSRGHKINPTNINFKANIDAQQLGYVWLFVVTGLFIIRMLCDSLMVRRPMLEPNLGRASRSISARVWTSVFSPA